MATELGKAYVQIMPSAKGIGSSLNGQIGPEMESSGSTAGLQLGGALVRVATGVISAAAIGKFFSASLSEGSDLQQSLGGIETLFKDNADKVKQYAADGYKTAGLSANDYMQTVTGFSASMLQSLGGDTAKAADLSNQALVDMSDNANKMGTSMESIQFAYQGFAKQNYTMLDNLKLGYGGTKEEMVRLLQDAQKISGVKYDISSFSDVTQAIHVMQTQLDITGTTAKEAATTFSGSFASMKSAFQNVLGNLSLGRDLQPSLNALVETASTFLFDNFIPMVGNIFKALPGAIMTLVKEGGKSISSHFSSGFVDNAIKGIREGLSSGLVVIGDVFKALPDTVMSLVSEGGKAIASQFSNAFSSDSIKSIFDGLYNSLAMAFISLPSSISEPLMSVLTLFNNLRISLQPIFDGLFTAFGQLPGLLSTMGSVITPIIQMVGDAIGQMDFSGFQSLASSIIPAVQSAFTTFWGIAGPALSQGIQSFVDLWNAAQPLITVLASALMPAFTILGSFLGGVFKGIMDTVTFAFDAVKIAIDFLTPVISLLVQGFNFIAPVLTTVAEWVGYVVGAFTSLGGSGTSLKTIMEDVWSRVSGAVSNGGNLIRGVVENIKGFFSSLFSIDISGAGRAIIDGFLGGLKSAFNGVKDFVGGIAGWIAQHKGPISYDKRLLIPAGKAIMGSLDNGLQSGFGSVQGTVLGIAGTIQDQFGSGLNLSNISTNINASQSGEFVNPTSGYDRIVNLLKDVANRPVYGLFSADSVSRDLSPYMLTAQNNQNNRMTRINGGLSF